MSSDDEDFNPDALEALSARSVIFQFAANIFKNQIPKMKAKALSKKSGLKDIEFCLKPKFSEIWFRFTKSQISP